jgi:hypothetical protein
MKHKTLLGIFANILHILGARGRGALYLCNSVWYDYSLLNVPFGTMESRYCLSPTLNVFSVSVLHLMVSSLHHPWTLIPTVLFCLSPSCVVCWYKSSLNLSPGIFVIQFCPASYIKVQGLEHSILITLQLLWIRNSDAAYLAGCLCFKVPIKLQ